MVDLQETDIMIYDLCDKIRGVGGILNNVNIGKYKLVVMVHPWFIELYGIVNRSLSTI